MDNAPLSNDDIAKLVSPRERRLFALIALVSVVLYAPLVLVLAGALFVAVGGEVPASNLAPLLYIPLLAAFFFVSQAYAVGRLRGNGIRVSERQFPVIHELVSTHARRIGLETVPPVYVVEAGGVLNAFAMKFFGREFVVLYADVVALAQDQGRGALGFVIGHELGHIRRGHLRWRWLTLPGRLVPFLGAAYSRACEYTCDRIGAACEPAHAVRGLLVLAAGRSLYAHVDAVEYADQVQTEAGFWVTRAELAASHPFLPKRIAALLAAGVPRPVPAVAAS